ncbi:MAG TPA: protealysin inhibitor emfourin, partial [Anaerolineales bacterium]|nr:protealysin inhibitor emfourin [Anaerolineales bacterium]
ELIELVAAAKFFDLPAKVAASDVGADQFQYKLTIEAEGRRHTIEVEDTSAPAALQPLLRRLTVLARSSSNS